MYKYVDPILPSAPLHTPHIQALALSGLLQEQVPRSRQDGLIFCGLLLHVVVANHHEASRCHHQRRAFHHVGSPRRQKPSCAAATCTAAACAAATADTRRRRPERPRDGGVCFCHGRCCRRQRYSRVVVLVAVVVPLEHGALGALLLDAQFGFGVTLYWN